jgi:hypothetical protein
MQIRNLVPLLFLLCCLSCKNTKQDEPDKNNDKGTFDKVKWATKEDKDYPYRNELLKNFIVGQRLKRLKREEVLDMLGQPDSGDSNHLGYIIEQKRIGIMVLHTRSLVVFIENGIVTATKMHE